MYFISATNRVIGSMGWVDKGRLWEFDLGTLTENCIPINGASFVGIVKGKDGIFTFIHHDSSEEIISLRHESDFHIEVSGVRRKGKSFEILGNPSSWSSVDKYVLVSYEGTFHLLHIHASVGTVTEIDLSWFYQGTFDKLWQGITGIFVQPNEKSLFVTVQRSSSLIKVDLPSGSKIGEILLPGGNSISLGHSTDKNLMLIKNYGTLCLVDTSLQSVISTIPVSDIPSSQFVGDYYLIDNDRCAVARPFSNDVAFVSLTSNSIDRLQPIGQQPLALCVTPSGGLITRDWKTGKVNTHDVRS